MQMPRAAIVMGGIPATNLALYHRVRFMVGDPTAYAEIPAPDGSWTRVFICRDIELERARRHAQADRVHCPADFTPDTGLSGDRETASAQGVVECLRRNNITRVIADRSLPFIYAHHIQQAGIALQAPVRPGRDTARN